jgi:hypothetical protein
MKRILEQIALRGKIVLCIILVLNLNFVVGCGGLSSLLPGATVRVPVGSNQELIDTLAGTPFANATAIDVNQVTKTFKMVFADGAQQMSGSFTENNGELFITQFTVGNGNQAVNFALNLNKEITDITTSQGVSWQRPLNTQAPGAPRAPTAPGARTVTGSAQDYVAANADLVALAEQLDSQGATPKDGQGSLIWLAAAALSGILLIPGGVLANILFALGAIGIIRAVLRI